MDVEVTNKVQTSAYHNFISLLHKVGSVIQKLAYVSMGNMREWRVLSTLGFSTRMHNALFCHDMSHADPP